MGTEYDISPVSDDISIRFKEIIKKAYEKTGKRIVILVDEHDKPLVSNLHNREMSELYRNELSTSYSNFKSSAEYIRLVFLTGVSRFAHLLTFNFRHLQFEQYYPLFILSLVSV